MKKSPFFIFLFTVYPSLALLVQNFREVDANIIIRPLFFSILLGSIFCAISFLLIRRWPQALLVSTVFIISFFSFGHISIFVEASGFATALGDLGGSINIILSLTALLVIFYLCRAILKTNRDLSQVYQILNVISLFLVLSSAFMLVSRYLAQQATSPIRQNEGSPQKAAGPDVYYIILDAYGRGFIEITGA
jgi:hypothetical protein